MIWGCVNLPWQPESSGEKEPAWRVLLPGQLWFGFVKAGACLCSGPGHLCSPSHSASWKVAEMQGLVYSCGGVSLSCDDGPVPGVSVYPPNSQTRAGRDLFSLQGWKCGFICLGLRSLSCSHFPGLCFGEGCSEGWCVVLCLSGRRKGRCLSGCGRWWC